MKTTGKAIAIIVFACFIHNHVAEPTYGETPSFMTLGHLRGSTYPLNRAYGISADRRTIVGTQTFAQLGPYEYSTAGWRWRDGVMESLGLTYGQQPTDISAAGPVSADGSTLIGYNGLNTLRLQGSTITPFPTLPGDSPQTYANSLSWDGRTVVGVSTNEWQTQFQGWILRDGVLTGLGDLGAYPESTFSYAMGVSGNGAVAVGFTTANPNDWPADWPVSNANEAFSWTNGHMTGLGFLNTHPVPNPDDPSQMLQMTSEARAASYDGSVVVGFSTSDNTGLFEHEPVRWVNGVPFALGFLPGGGWHGGEAKAVSADGSVIVGWSESADGTTAFVWEEAHGTRALSRILTEDFGVDLGGWHPVIADAISADGTVIVGLAVNEAGEGQPFRAVIPEPAAGLMLVTALLRLPRPRRR